MINEEIKLDINTLEKNVKEKQINKDKDIILLKDISIEINKGEFVIILGPTGSGKSSLFNAILNNCHIYSTQSKPIINGELSYYSQQPWIISDTLKNNILFFKPFDLEKYLKKSVSNNSKKNNNNKSTNQNNSNTNKKRNSNLFMNNITSNIKINKIN